MSVIILCPCYYKVMNSLIKCLLFMGILYTRIYPLFNLQNPTHLHAMNYKNTSLIQSLIHRPPPFCRILPQQPYTGVTNQQAKETNGCEYPTHVNGIDPRRSYNGSDTGEGVSHQIVERRARGCTFSDEFGKHGSRAALLISC